MSQLQELSKRFSQESIDYAVSNLTEEQQDVLHEFLVSITYVSIFVSLEAKGARCYSKNLVPIYNGLEDSDFIKLVDVFSKVDTTNKQALFMLIKSSNTGSFMFSTPEKLCVTETVSSDSAPEAISRHNLSNNLSKDLKKMCKKTDVKLTVKEIELEIKIDKVAEVIEVMSKHHLNEEQFKKLITTDMEDVDSLEQVVSNIGKYGESIKPWSASIGELLSYEYPDTTLVQELSSPQE